MKATVSREGRRSQGGRKRTAPTLAMVRSAVTNGSTILPDIDHRSSWMRRYRDLIQDQLADLGGWSRVSEAQKLLVRRAAMLTLQLELMEQKFADNDGEAKGWQLDRYQRVTNTLRRTLEALQPGLVRPSQGDVTANVIEHLREVTA